ncbi:MAG: DUF4236 domain-containing protein [Saccharospirillum sp.]|nr:DUF4236 domain-containing protein [Saccharospirillum sp.]
MAFRFQRRIKIAPGIRVNISKSGAGLSVGPRGATASIGKRGLYGNLGIPGTGLSYRKKIDQHQQTSRNSNVNAPNSTLMKVDDDGALSFLYENGEDLPSSIANKIKRTNGDEIRSYLNSVRDKRNELLSTITELHKDIPAPTNNPEYIPKKFEEPKPSNGFWSGVLGFFVPSIKRQFHEKLKSWYRRKSEFESAENDRKELEEKQVFESIDAMDKVLSFYLSEIEWPSVPEIDYDLGSNNKTLALDIFLPSEEGLPNKEWSVPGNAYRLTSRKISESKRRQIYRDYAHAILLRIIGEVYARLPTVDHIMISAYRTGVDTATAQDTDEYILSAIVKRSTWQKIDFNRIARIDPVEAMKEHDLIRNMTKTGIFKPIKPYTTDDLERISND